jgi:membrane associated rhomboid family serine protease
VTVVVFFATTSYGSLDPDDPSPLMLDGFGIGVLGHVLVHADVLHLFGNMLFLWVFGNAVCARVGSIGYLASYWAFAIVVATAHVALSDRPAVGASAAINGVVGMFFVFYPKDYVTFAILGSGRAREAPAWVLVLLWLLLDLLGFLSGQVGVGHAAHIGGLLVGILLAVVLLKNQLVDEGLSPTLLDLNW